MTTNPSIRGSSCRTLGRGSIGTRRRYVTAKGLAYGEAQSCSALSFLRNGLRRVAGIAPLRYGMFEWNAGCVQLVQVRQYIQGLDYWAAQKLILQSFHCKDCLFRHIFFPFDLSFKLSLVVISPTCSNNFFFFFCLRRRLRRRRLEFSWTVCCNVTK